MEVVWVEGGIEVALADTCMESSCYRMQVKTSPATNNGTGRDEAESCGIPPTCRA